MKQRIITGIILIALVVLAVIFLKGIYFNLFSGLVVLLIAWEWSNLAGVKHIITRGLFVLLIALCIYGSTFIPIKYILYVSIIWWVFALILILSYKKALLPSISCPLRYIMGFFVIIPAWSAVVQLDQENIILLLFVILIVAAGDTGAYFAGKFLGKNKLAPIVSPKKTIEGLIGGLLAGGIVAIGFSILMGIISFRFFVIVFIGAVLVVAVSVIGDLFESLIKREADIKDSGNILPGHGGILDRTDSLLAALPLFALFNALFPFFN